MIGSVLIFLYAGRDDLFVYNWKAIKDNRPSEVLMILNDSILNGPVVLEIRSSRIQT
jgi:hypothetical protein